MKEIAPGITVDPTVRFGRPVVRGTRVPIETVLSELAGGMSMEDVETEFGIVREDVLAVLGYAARTIAQEQVRAVG